MLVSKRILLRKEVLIREVTPVTIYRKETNILTKWLPLAMCYFIRDETILDLFSLMYFKKCILKNKATLLRKFFDKL